MRGRLIPLLASASLAVVGCAGPWDVAVYNNDTDQDIGVRLRMSDRQISWVLQPQQFDTLIRASHQQAVTLELFDPVTCAVLTSEHLPEGPVVLAVAHQGVMGDGPWQIDAGVDSPDDAAVLEPNFDDCPQ